MSTRHIVRGATSAISLSCLLLSTPALAGQLFLQRFLKYDLIAPRDDIANWYETDCDTCLVLQAGLDTAAVPYVATYDRPGTFPDFEPYTTTATHTVSSGGTVGYGFIRGFVSASLETDQEGGFSASEAIFRASFTDTMTINPVDPALVGQPGTLTGSVQLDYLRSTTAQGSPGDPGELLGASVEGSVSIYSARGGGGGAFSEFDIDDSSPSSQYAITLTGDSGSPAPDSLTIPFLLGFTFGEAFEVTVELAARAYSSFEAGVMVRGEAYRASGTLNLLNTVAWQGISSVLDADGNPVDFSLASESGTDWTVPATVVPVPPAAWLLASALAGLALRKRRR